jgi:hypothetical protein
MMHGFLTLFAFVSVIFLPWPCTAVLALISGFFIPLLPLAIGLFADTLYYTPQAATLPSFTLWGALATVIAIFVHRRLRASIIRG